MDAANLETTNHERNHKLSGRKRIFFVFFFNNVEDRHLIFRNGLYFMGLQGLYLNKWTPDFEPS